MKRPGWKFTIILSHIIGFLTVIKVKIPYLDYILKNFDLKRWLNETLYPIWKKFFAFDRTVEKKKNLRTNEKFLCFKLITAIL